MAKIEGGLLSERASGTIGGLITYQGRRTYRQAHLKSTPMDRRSTGQLTQRNALALAVAVWKSLSAAEKLVYSLLSPKYNNNPGYNIFLTLNIGKIGLWKRFNEVQFGTTAKFGGPITS